MTRKRALPVSVVTFFSTSPGHFIRRLHQISTALFNAEAARFGVTPMQYVVLSAVALEPGMDQSTTASRVGLDFATVGGVALRLERRGLLERIPSPTDRRARLLTLTPAGLDLLRGLDAGVRRVRRALLAPLEPAEQEVLLPLLRKLYLAHMPLPDAAMAPREMTKAVPVTRPRPAVTRAQRVPQPTAAAVPAPRVRRRAT